jgi:cytochrome c553
MKRVFGFVIVSLIFGWVTAVTAAAQTAPVPWAYAIPPAPPAGAPAAQPAPDTSMKSLPPSTSQFTRQQISNQYGPADWFPGDHPVMPDIVKNGKQQTETRACSLCHYPNGKGRPENAGVSGLPVSYFIQTLKDFQTGKRKSAEQRKANVNGPRGMIDIAKALTEDEMRQAAEYFGSMKWTPWIRVVETETVPKMRIQGGMHIPLAGNEREPIGQRIIETPENPEHTEVLRDPRSGFIAYVPVGSVRKGEALVTTGGGKITACGACHGADLKGLGPVPGIAGRSPSYMMRQLWDMKTGARAGEWTGLMAPVVAPLTEEELMNVVAYVSSRTP